MLSSAHDTARSPDSSAACISVSIAGQSISVPVASHNDVRWLAAAAATKLANATGRLLEHAASTALVAKLEPTGEIIPPNTLVLGLLDRLRSAGETILVELDDTAEVRNADLRMRSIRSSDSPVKRNVWQAQAFNVSKSGQAATSSITERLRSQQAQDEKSIAFDAACEHVRQVDAQLWRLVATLQSPDHSSASATSRVLSSAWPFLRLHLITSDAREVGMIKLHLLVHFADIHRMFMRFASCAGRPDDVGTSSMQLCEWIHMGQVAGLFPLPVSSETATTQFNRVAAIMQKQSNDNDSQNEPVRFLTLLSFMEALTCLADAAFGQELNPSAGTRNGPGRALEKLLTQLVPLANRIVSGPTRRMLSDPSSKTWVAPRVAALQRVFAHYSLPDPAPGSEQPKPAAKGGAAAAAKPTSAVFEQHQSLSDLMCTPRHLMKLSQFATLLVHAGLAPAAVLKPDVGGAASSKPSTTPQPGKPVLTLVEIRRAFYGAQAIKNTGDASVDGSGSARSEDPFERLTAGPEFIEALARAGLHGWAPQASLGELDPDSSYDDVNRVEKLQSKLRDAVADGIDRAAAVVAAADAKANGKGKDANAGNRATGGFGARSSTKSKGGEGDAAAAAGGDGKKAGPVPATVKAVHPKDTRRGSVLADQIFTLSRGEARRGSVVQAPPITLTPRQRQTGNDDHDDDGSESGEGSSTYRSARSSADVEAELSTPRTHAIKLMTTLRDADSPTPCKASEQEVFSQLARWAIEAVSDHLSKQPGHAVPPSALPPYDVVNLVRRMNIQAAATKATVGSLAHRPSTARIPGYEQLLHIHLPARNQDEPESVHKAREMAAAEASIAVLSQPAHALHTAPLDDHRIDSGSVTSVGQRAKGHQQQQQQQQTAARRSSGTAAPPLPYATAAHACGIAYETMSISTTQQDWPQHTNRSPARLHHQHLSPKSSTSPEPADQPVKRRSPVKAAFPFKVA